jgi:hypothetical protein
MKGLVTLTLLCLVSALPLSQATATDFRPAENALGEFRSVRYENVYTKVPTTGKLVSIKISDNGTVYYICREKSGFAIYNLEIRPVENARELIQQELKEKTRNWDRNNPDELLFTKEQYDREWKSNIRKYSDAVWIRNEIVVPEPKGDARSAR